MSEMWNMVREKDWSETPLGAAEQWPAGLRAAVDLILGCEFPMIVLWGPDLIQVYNDGYRAIMADKHPRGLGQATRECWPEVWHINEPIYARVWRDETLTFEDQVYPLQRHGYSEDVYLTICYSPLHGDKGEVAGVLVTLFETTGRVNAERERAQVDAALRNSEQRLRALVTATSYAVYSMSPDWREMRQLSGQGFLADTKAPSRGWLEQYIPADEQEVLWEAIQQAIAQKGVFEFEHRIHLADGTLGWTWSIAVPLLDANGDIVEWFGAASDITARRRAEAALRESEQRLQSIANLVPDLLWESQSDGAMSWFNQRWMEYTGQHGEQGNSRGWVEAIHPVDRETVLRRYRLAVEQGRPLRQEHRMRRYDGEYRWFVVNAFPLTNESGSVAKVYSAATDIHEQRLTLEALRESEDLRRIALEGGRMVAWRWDTRNRWVLGRENAALWGIQTNQGTVPIEDYMERMSPEGAAAIEGVMRKPITPSEEFDGQIRIKSGSKAGRWIRWRGRAERERPWMINGVSFDVTEQKLAEERLQESEQRLRLLVENVREYALFQTDLEGRVTTWNPGAERVFGYGSAEILGVPVQRLLALSDHQIGLVAEELGRVSKGERLQDARWLLRKDGTRFWAQWASEPLQDESGAVRGVVKVLRDETDRRRAEESMQESLAEKEALLREVHHRVKNNLQVITSLLNLQASQVNDERVLSMFDEARNRVYAIAAIHELIYKSASLSAVHLVDYARQLVPDVVKMFGAQDRIEVAVEGDGATLELERAVPFGLLLNEMVSNVCKHAFPDNTRGELRIRLSDEPQMIVLEVLDNGVGLPPGFGEKQPATLGFQLMQALVRQLRGSMTVVPAPGARLRVVIPERLDRNGLRA